ncbi:MAG TPA: uracil-DNA glycosylase [Gammaproteobacteria bacterium]|nr:uracil-DNA glycosylase [Gammaproteobacteria bacterium]
MGITVAPAAAGVHAESAAISEPAQEVVGDFLTTSYPLPVEPTTALDLKSVSTLDWPQLEAQVAACTACGLHKGRTQTVFGVGNREAQLLVIGEAPGATEDRQGEPFVGRAGKLLDAMLLAINLQRKEVFIANIIKCRPPKNRDPSQEEAAACRPYLQRQIELIEPKVILAVGRIAAHNLLETEQAIGKLRGRVHTLGQHNLSVVVTYHPAYLLRNPKDKAKAWQDLKQVTQLMRQ